MYKFSSRVRYSETDMGGNLTPEAIINYFQDCTTFNSEDLGIGVDFMKEQGMAWVLSSWQIVIDRYPHFCEQIRIGTAPYDFKGFLGYRNFLMETETGEQLACANSIWTLLDIHTGLPARPLQKMYDCYALEERLPMEYAPRKIALPKRTPGEPATEENSFTAKEPIVVKQHHLDTNCHVNNGQYVKMAMDFLQEGITLRELRVEYKKSAVLDDTIFPEVHEEDNRLLVTLNNEEMKPYSIVELLW